MTNPVLLRCVPLLGIGFFLLVAWLLSENRRQICWRSILLGLIILFGLSGFFLATNVGQKIQSASGDGISVLVKCADEGAKGIFSAKLISDSDLVCPGLTFLPSIIFIGALTSVLYYLGLVQLVVRFFAFLVKKLLGVSGSESLIAVSSIFLGMVEAPLTVKPYLKRFSRSELFCMMTSGMASIAGGVMVVYAGLLERAGCSPGHLLIASILSVFSAIVIAKIMLPPESTDPGSEAVFCSNVSSNDNPLNDNPSNGGDSDDPVNVNILDAACTGASEGLQLALNVLGMIIAFFALIALVNMILGGVGEISGESVTLQRIFGWFFAPIAWLLGIPWSECSFAGQLLGEKTVLNEFIAFMDMTNPDNIASLSDRSRIIMSYALCGFANFGSLAIMIGGIGRLVPSRRAEIAQLAVRSLISGTFAALITACLAAIYV